MKSSVSLRLFGAAVGAPSLRFVFGICVKLLLTRKSEAPVFGTSAKLKPDA
jgi:hypothetical protein